MQNKKFYRWSDKDPRLAKMLDVLSEMSKDEQNIFAKRLSELINIHKKKYLICNNIVSLGSSKVLNLYKASNNRRWYDQNKLLSYPLNIISTFPDDLIKRIIDDLAKTFDYMLEQ